jgi:hypothetical protein
MLLVWTAQRPRQPGDDAPLSPQESAGGMLRVAGRLSPADSGALLSHDGAVLTATQTGKHRRPKAAPGNGEHQQ